MDTFWKDFAANAAAQTWPEILAVVTTFINVVLVLRNNIWNWPWGIASVLLYGYVFYHQQLLSSAGLQILYYLPMSVLGWWYWLRGGPKKDDDLPITQISLTARIGWFLVTLPLAWLLSLLTEKLGAKMAFWDALATALSVVGQIFLTRKQIENWLFWIAVNILYVFYILPSQKLYLSTLLYFVLLLLAFKGWFDWKKAMLPTLKEQVLADYPEAAQ